MGSLRAPGQNPVILRQVPAAADPAEADRMTAATLPLVLTAVLPESEFDWCAGHSFNRPDLLTTHSFAVKTGLVPRSFPACFPLQVPHGHSVSLFSSS